MITPINSAANVELIHGKNPKTVIDNTNATYMYVAEAEAPNTPTTTAKWRRYRVNKSTLAIDWCQNTSGVETDEFVFTGVFASLSTATYGE